MIISSQSPRAADALRHGWLAHRYPALRGVLERIEFNLPVLTATAMLGFFVWEEHDRQPWEQEAIYLGRTGR